MLITTLDIILLLLLLGLLHNASSRLMSLSYRVLLGLALGIAYGFLLRISPPDSLFAMIKNSLSFIGNGYLLLLKMLVVPLILTSTIYAILNLGYGNERVIKKMTVMTCGLLLSMTAISSLIGLLVGQWFNIGQGMHLPVSNITPKHHYSGVVDSLLAMLPSNPILAMMQENTIAILVFAVLLGLAARMLDANDQHLQTFKNIIAALFAIVKKLASLILNLTPYGILALMSLLILDQGTNLLGGMLNFIAAIYTAMILVFIMHTFILFIFRLSPLTYFKKAYTALFVAFTTRSSLGTLPVTEETLSNKFNSNQAVAAFVPSIGATIGMNACAGVFPAMLVVMTLAILQQPLTLQMMIMVMVINAIASLGISGIPGTAYIAATITLTSLNLPYAVVALVQGIDPIVDMGRTATNVNGVLTTALVVDKAMSRVFAEQNELILENDN